MANFFEVIKMANFCVMKMANFFYQNGELCLLKRRISFYAYSQNGEFFALVMKCLIGFTQKSSLFSDIQKSILSRPVAVHEPSEQF